MFWLKLLFFLSGSAGLIYEIIWTRLFADILGSTAISMTVVFSTFLFALALGAQIAGNSATYGKKALLLYGKLELGIAFFSLLTSILLIQGKSWLAVHLPTSEHYFLALFYKFLLTAILIGVPVFLMGTTLPVMLNASKGWTLPQDVVTQLYGWNTLGAATGSFLAGFILIWKVGLHGTLLVAILINFGVGILVLCLRNKLSLPEHLPISPEISAQDQTSLREAFLWRVVAFLSGFTVLGYEILWGRLAKFLLGDRTIAITVLLVCFIACLGLSSLIAPALGKRWGGQTFQKNLQLIAWILFFASFLHLAIIPLAHATIAGKGIHPWIPISTLWLRPIVVTFLLIFFPVLTLGFVFPLMIWSAKQLNATPGRVIGNLYFINTVGATLGAMTASYLLSRWIGTFGGFFAFSTLILVFAVGLLLWTSSSKKIKIFVLVSLEVLIVIGYVFPYSLIKLRKGERLLESQEDEYGIQVIVEAPNQRIRVRNNRVSMAYELGHPDTSEAQQMATHWSMLFARHPKEILNIGTGYGITAGTFILYPEVTFIETVEILPFLVKNQHYFSAYNFDYLKDPRVQLKLADGRHLLATSSKKYDVISINVLDPYLPGSASLYTVDFWNIAKDHLNTGGVFNQLFWGKDIGLLLKGLKSVFPTVLCFSAYHGAAYNVIAFPETLTPEQLSCRWERFNPSVRHALKGLGYTNPEIDLIKLLEETWKRKERIDELIAKTTGPLHTDDFPILEFKWFHGVDDVSIFNSPMIKD